MYRFSPGVPDPQFRPGDEQHRARRRRPPTFTSRIPRQRRAAQTPALCRRSRQVWAGRPDALLSAAGRWPVSAPWPGVRSPRR